MHIGGRFGALIIIPRDYTPGKRAKAAARSGGRAALDEGGGGRRRASIF